MIQQICINCGEQFQIFSPHARKQQRCPRCLAEDDDRIKSIPLKRRSVWQGPVKIESLPKTEWEKRPPKTSRNSHYYRMEIRGSDLGYPWQGQITLFSEVEYKPGDVVWLRVMRSFHVKKRIVFEDPQTGRERMAVLHKDIQSEDLPELVESGKLARAALDRPLEDFVQMREYWRLEHTYKDPEFALSWRVGDEPTDLDAVYIGRQIQAGEGDAIVYGALVVEYASSLDVHSYDYEEYEFEDEDEVLLGESALERLREAENAS